MIRRFQNEVATGKLTLSVAVVLSILLWIGANLVRTIPISKTGYLLEQEFLNRVSTGFLNNSLSFVSFALCGYLLIELNNAYSVIRIRTSLHVSIFCLLVAAFPFLHTLNNGCISGLLSTLSIYFLFRSYQCQQPVGYIYHALLFLGIGSLLFPQLLYFIPVLLLGAYKFKALTLRTFFAGIIGLSVPYWFLLGHAFFYNEMNLFYAPFIELGSFRPIDYSQVGLPVIVSVSFIILLLIVSSVHYMITSYQDKIRVRSYLNFLIYFAVFIIIFLCLQPQYAETLLSLLLPITAFLAGHLFTLSNTKVSNLFFIFSILLLIAVTVLNLWIL